MIWDTVEKFKDINTFDRVFIKAIMMALYFSMEVYIIAFSILSSFVMETTDGAISRCQSKA